MITSILSDQTYFLRAWLCFTRLRYGKRPSKDFPSARVTIAPLLVSVRLLCSACAMDHDSCSSSNSSNVVSIFRETEIFQRTDDPNLYMLMEDHSQSHCVQLSISTCKLMMMDWKGCIAFLSLSLSIYKSASCNTPLTRFNIPQRWIIVTWRKNEGFAERRLCRTKALQNEGFANRCSTSRSPTENPFVQSVGNMKFK